MTHEERTATTTADPELIAQIGRGPWSFSFEVRDEAGEVLLQHQCGGAKRLRVWRAWKQRLAGYGRPPACAFHAPDNPVSDLVWQCANDTSDGGKFMLTVPGVGHVEVFVYAEHRGALGRYESSRKFTDLRAVNGHG